MPVTWSAQFHLLLIYAVQMLPVAGTEWTMRQAQSLWSVTGGREPDVETVMKVLWLSAQIWRPGFPWYPFGILQSPGHILSSSGSWVELPTWYS